MNTKKILAVGGVAALALAGVVGFSGEDFTPEEIAAVEEIRVEKLKDKDFIKNARATDTVLEERGFSRSYKAETKNLRIENPDTLVDIDMLSSYHQMLGAGESVMVAELKIKDWKGKNNLFDELRFYNRENFQKEGKQFTFKYAEEKTITMELPADFPEQAKDNEMFEQVVGDWENAVEFTSLDELPHKNIRVGIFTETILGEKIEWLPTIDGFDIYEWAAYDITQIDSLEHDTIRGQYNSLVMIDSTHFILAYCGTDYDGFIKTFSIDGSYNITQIDSLEHDIAYGSPLNKTASSCRSIGKSRRSNLICVSRNSNANSSSRNSTTR